MLFTKREKKLSDDDIERWEKLKNTMDLKLNNKSIRDTGLEKSKQIINNKKIPNLIMCIIFKSKTHCLLKLYKKIKFLVFKKI